MVVVFVFDKFISYLVSANIIFYTDQACIKYLIVKKDAKQKLIRQVLLLQEFDMEIRDRNGVDNQIADHLSKIPESIEERNKVLITKTIPD